MSGRAVGGAAGIGCGAFGLVGLLVGVGLTVWLGMRVTDSVSPAAPSGGGATTAPSELGGDGLSGLGTLTVPGSGSDGTVALTPSTGIADGATIEVAADGLAPGPVEVTQCLAFQTRAGGVDGACDRATTIGATVGADGTLQATVAARRVIRVLDTPYDCAAFAGACVVIVHPNDALTAAPEAPLDLAEGGPPVSAEPPPTG